MLAGGFARTKPVETWGAPPPPAVGCAPKNLSLGGFATLGIYFSLVPKNHEDLKGATRLQTFPLRK